MKKSEHEVELRQALFFFTATALLATWKSYFSYLTFFDWVLIGLGFLLAAAMAALTYVEYFSEWAKKKKERLKLIFALPTTLTVPSKDAVTLGLDKKLGIKIFLTDKQRRSHVHILGATGSGKTESVILPLIGQDHERGYPSIILDAKGDDSFKKFLEAHIAKDKLQIFDLNDPKSLAYDPLAFPSPAIGAERLHANLEWSEKYYESRAKKALQLLFQAHFDQSKRNPTIRWLSDQLSTEELYYNALGCLNDKSKKKTLPQLSELGLLKDQLDTLCFGHLRDILSPEKDAPKINIAGSVEAGHVLYFRLQSMISPKGAKIMAKLIISHLNFAAATLHSKGGLKDGKICSVFLDEFANFVCPEFLLLLSMARSAGFALHFSHQSFGDLKGESEGYLSQVVDNSATKVVLRVHDPDTAEYVARTFGTKETEKITHKVDTNGSEIEQSGQGTVRDAHKFVVSPDELKRMPTGQGCVLIAHGQDVEGGAAHAFALKFEFFKSKLKKGKK